MKRGPSMSCSRRRFLARAAAASSGVAAVPHLLTSTAAGGRARSYAANEQLQIAVVGPGGRGSGFVAEDGWSSGKNFKTHRRIG